MSTQPYRMQPRAGPALAQFWAMALTAVRGFPPPLSAYQRRPPDPFTQSLTAGTVETGLPTYHPIPNQAWNDGAYGVSPHMPILFTAPTSGHAYYENSPKVLGDVPPLRFHRVYPYWPNARPSYQLSGVPPGPLPASQPGQVGSLTTQSTLNLAGGTLGFIAAPPPS